MILKLKYCKYKNIFLQDGRFFLVGGFLVSLVDDDLKMNRYMVKVRFNFIFERNICKIE